MKDEEKREKEKRSGQKLDFLLLLDSVSVGSVCMGGEGDGIINTFGRVSECGECWRQIIFFCAGWRRE